MLTGREFHSKVVVETKVFPPLILSLCCSFSCFVDETRKCLRRIYIKIEFSSQWRESLLFWFTNMAAVTSRENDLYCRKQLYFVRET